MSIFLQIIASCACAIRTKSFTKAVHSDTMPNASICIGIQFFAPMSLVLKASHKIVSQRTEHNTIVTTRSLRKVPIRHKRCLNCRWSANTIFWPGSEHRAHRIWSWPGSKADAQHRLGSTRLLRICLTVRYYTHTPQGSGRWQDQLSERCQHWTDQ